jgi:hypothetical protein
MRFALLALVLVVVAASAVYFSYGTIEPCGILREKMRRQATREGGNLGGFLATIMPDSLVNGLIVAQYNKPVGPALCIGILIGSEKPVGIRDPDGAQR